MIPIASQVAELRRLGAIVTALPSSGPVVVTRVTREESIRLLEAALRRSYVRNEKVIAASPPFLHGRDERVMARDSCGRIKAKAAGGGDERRAGGLWLLPAGYQQDVESWVKEAVCR